MNFLMKKTIPIVTDNINNMSLEDKKEIMEMMIPPLMEGHDFDDRIELARTSIPLMLKDLDKEKMKEMIYILMPLLVDMMKEKGINVSSMINKMFPQFIKNSVTFNSENENS